MKAVGNNYATTQYVRYIVSLLVSEGRSCSNFYSPFLSTNAWGGHLSSC